MGALSGQYCCDTSQATTDRTRHRRPPRQQSHLHQNDRYALFHALRRKNSCLSLHIPLRFVSRPLARNGSQRALDPGTHAVIECDTSTVDLFSLSVYVHLAHVRRPEGSQSQVTENVFSVAPVGEASLVSRRRCVLSNVLLAATC